MEIGSAESLVVFLLAAVPGVIVLEVLRRGRPRLRERGGLQTLAEYLLASASAWAMGAVVWDVEERLQAAVRLTEEQATQLVDAYGGLAIRVMLVAFGLGFALRFSTWVGGKVGNALLRRSSDGHALAQRVARLAGAGIAPSYAWDELFARLQREERAQVAHVRFQDGTSIYGLFARYGRADYEADGRGLVLDRELRVTESGDFLAVPESVGVFIAPDAIASVSFVNHSAEADNRGDSSHRRRQSRIEQNATQ